MSTLDEAHIRFTQASLSGSVLINSVPKCGTMLLRNILVMFVPWEQISWPFITNDDLPEPPETPTCFTGHLKYSARSLKFARKTHHLVLVRHPHSQVLSYARFMWSRHWKDSSLGQFIREQEMTFDEVVRLTITGWQAGNEIIDSPKGFFIHNAIAWSGQATIVKYEELRKAVSELDEDYFRRLLDAAGLNLTADWRERVTVASDPEYSSTASGKFSTDDRKYLTNEERALFESVAPGICKALGYRETPD